MIIAAAAILLRTYTQVSLCHCLYKYFQVCNYYPQQPCRPCERNRGRSQSIRIQTRVRIRIAVPVWKGGIGSHSWYSSQATSSPPASSTRYRLVPTGISYSVSMFERKITLPGSPCLLDSSPSPLAMLALFVSDPDNSVLTTYLVYHYLCSWNHMRFNITRLRMYKLLKIADWH